MSLSPPSSFFSLFSPAKNRVTGVISPSSTLRVWELNFFWVSICSLYLFFFSFFLPSHYILITSIPHIHTRPLHRLRNVIDTHTHLFPHLLRVTFTFLTRHCDRKTESKLYSFRVLLNKIKNVCCSCIHKLVDKRITFNQKTTLGVLFFVAKMIDMFSPIFHVLITLRVNQEIKKTNKRNYYMVWYPRISQVKGLQLSIIFMVIQLDNF